MILHRAIRASLPALVGASLLLAGCDSELSICTPDLPVTRLTGMVRTGGDPSLCTIEARGVDLPEGISRLIRGQPGPDGSYALDVPPGRFTLHLDVPADNGRYVYTATGPSYYPTPPDTLTVESGQIGNLDFELGALRLEVTLPDDSRDGTWAKFILHRQGQDGSPWDEDFQCWATERIISESATLVAEGVLPGGYQVELLLENPGSYLRGEHIWLPDADGPDQAAWYTVVAGSRVDLTYTTGTPPVFLAGRIGGAWLEMGLEEAPNLSVMGADSLLVVDDDGLVADDGSYALTIYRPRPVKLLVTQNGMSRYIGGPDFDTATVYDLAPGDTITGIDLTTSAITLDASASSPANFPYPDFELYTADATTLLGTFVGTLYNEVIFPLPNLWPGDFLLKITPHHGYRGYSPWLTQWYPGTTVVDQAERITITTSGEILPLSMTLVEGGSISGRIVGDQVPFSYRYVRVTTANSPDQWGAVSAWNPDFAFSVLGLPDGGYRVGQASSRNATETIWYPGTTDWDTAEIITIENAGSVTGIDIPLE